MTSSHSKKTDGIKLEYRLRPPVDIDKPSVATDLAQVHAAGGCHQSLACAFRCGTAPRKLSLARAIRGIIGIEVSEDETLNLVAQLDASISGSGREQQEREAHNVTATMGYIADFVQEQPDARLKEAHVLRFHRMLAYSVPYRIKIRGRYRPRRGRRLLPAPPTETKSGA